MNSAADRPAVPQDAPFGGLQCCDDHESYRDYVTPGVVAALAAAGSPTGGDDAA